MTTFRFLATVVAAVLGLLSPVHAGSHGLAPEKTAGLDIVLTIEHTESSLQDGFPTMGAVRQSYSPDGTYTYSGFGGPHHLTGTGTYTYTKTGSDTAVEEAVQYSDFFVLPYRMEYTFVTPNAGRWKQYFAGGLIVFEGSFATSSANARALAPESFAGRTFILAEHNDRQFPRITTLMHREASYASRTLGVAKPDRGTYATRRHSARSVVEETTGAEGLVVRSFTFTSHNGGYWKATRAADGARSEGLFILLR